MIHKCLVVSVDTNIVSDNYLFGGVFHFDNWTDGVLTAYTSRLVDVDTEIVNKLGIAITSFQSGGDFILRFNFPNGATGLIGDIILKDMRNLIIGSMYYGNNIYPTRRMEISTSLYANVSEEVAASRTGAITCAGPTISGDISNFGKFINMRGLNLAKTQNIDNPSLISGTLESLAESLIYFGKTSGTFQVIGNGIVTANGVAVAVMETKTITFSGSTYTIS